MILKYHHTDKGFCRVCFTTKGKVNPKNTYYYCMQEEGNAVKNVQVFKHFSRCTMGTRIPSNLHRTCIYHFSRSR